MYQHEGGTGFGGSLDWYPVIKKSISHTITRPGKETIFFFFAFLRVLMIMKRHVQKRQIAITLEAFGIDL